PKRKFLVAPNLRERDRRSLVLAALAGLISLGAHGLLIFLVLNLDLGSAQSSTDADLRSAPIIDDPREEKKDAEKDQPINLDRNQEDRIDLTDPKPGLNPGKEPNFDLPKPGEDSIPPLPPDARTRDTPAPSDPAVPLPPGIRPLDGDSSRFVEVPGPARD